MRACLSVCLPVLSLDCPDVLFRSVPLSLCPLSPQTERLPDTRDPARGHRGEEVHGGARGVTGRPGRPTEGIGGRREKAVVSPTQEKAPKTYRRGEQGEARRGEARRGKARQGKARQGKARQGKARQGKAREGKAREGKGRQERAREGQGKSN